MHTLRDIIKERILVLDGAMGTMVSRYGVKTGNTDQLNITAPDVVRDIHRRYLAAGADLITTNTFSSQRISQADFGLEDECYQMALAGAVIARQCADAFSTEEKPRFVLGDVGPTNKTASLSPDVNDASLRDVTYDQLFAAYSEQIRALLDGGVDAILIETVFDTLNCKAAIDAAQQEREALAERRRAAVDCPIMLSVTVSDMSGRTLSGQTLEAFLSTVSSYDIFSVGLNCGFGAREMKPFLSQLASRAPYYVSAHPNAGLPNELGEYNETAETMLPAIADIIDAQMVNIIGGCCGTDETFIAEYSRIVEGKPVRVPHPRYRKLHLAGLESFSPIVDSHGMPSFTNVGERCNVAGSRKFLRLISQHNYDEAIEIARKQVADGALVIDINMDDSLLDAKDEMVRFVNLMAAEPDIAAVPLMIDSSKWDVIESALKNVQGKCIVNSISLKEGEKTFVEHARCIKRFGAAVVVMCFDEEGQATTYERRIKIASRAYKLLTEVVGMNPLDIIFDPNILSIATGIDEHDSYAADFIRATEWIHNHLPGAHVSGGVSNLSFSFRGNNYIREAMHAVFLYHAMKAGMDFGIVNPATKVTYADIPQGLLRLIEDVILDRRKGAAEELVDEAQRISADGNVPAADGKSVADADQSWRQDSVDERLAYAIRKGVTKHLETDINEALDIYGRAVDIIEGPLMTGMDQVGKLFGEGKMFLPQVVKTARTMKQAVKMLEPYMQNTTSDSPAKAGKVVMATVRGDVHDIGKNIVAVVMACNSFDITDLGVMVPPEVVVETAIKEHADIVCLSGLITPSLDEMVTVVREMDRRGLDVPVIIGGATTSELHAALKIAPEYRGLVIWSKDAAQSAVYALKLVNNEQRQKLASELTERYRVLRENYHKAKEPVIPIEEARKNKLNLFD